MTAASRAGRASAIATRSAYRSQAGANVVGSPKRPVIGPVGGAASSRTVRSSAASTLSPSTSSMATRSPSATACSASARAATASERSSVRSYASIVSASSVSAEASRDHACSYAAVETSWCPSSPSPIARAAAPTMIGPRRDDHEEAAAAVGVGVGGCSGALACGEPIGVAVRARS